MFRSSRRSLYRVTYPLVERPSFEIGRQIHEVVDCSERGLRYEVKDKHVPALGTQVQGVIHFRRGNWVEILGEVIRTHKGVVVLSLEAPGIAFADVLAEQRYLRAKGYTLRDPD